jgi:hypothetical protein
MFQLAGPGLVPPLGNRLTDADAVVAAKMLEEARGVKTRRLIGF